MSKANNYTSLQYRNIWLILGWVQILAVALLTLTPKLPDLVDEISFGDKIGHFAAYALIMFWFCQLYIKNFHRLLLAISFVIMGITLEYLQELGGVRMYEVADMFANATGVLIGTILAYLGMDTLLLKFEKLTGINKQP